MIFRLGINDWTVSSTMYCWRRFASLAQQLPSLVLGLAVSVRARRAHGHLQNLCQQALARFALTCLKIRLRQSELESHVLRCDTEPLVEVGNRTLQIPAEHSRQLACDLPQGAVSAAVLIVWL